MVRIKTSLSTVLAAVRDKLVKDGLFPAASCYDSVDPDVVAEKAPPGDRFAGVTFNEFAQPQQTVTTDDETDEVSVVEGEIVVSLYFNINVDEIGRDDQVLTSEREGAVPLIEAVARSLNNQELTNADGDSLLLCSLNFLGVRKGNRVGKAAMQWRKFDLRFWATFDWDLAGLTVYG